MNISKKNQSFAKKQLANKGSTLITVLVAVSFLVILGSIILAASASNLRMKQVEYVAKKNFYSDEQILDDIYNGIGKVANTCLAEAYADVLSKVTTDTGTPEYVNQEDAYKAFSQGFIDRFTAVYQEGPFDLAINDELESYIIDRAAGQLVGYRETEVINVSAADTTPYQYVFRELVVRYHAVDGSGGGAGYESTITTDIVVEIPYINFFQDSSRILDYALIGNRGVYFNGASFDVTGNVYAGIDDHESDANKDTFRNENVYGGLNFFNSTVTVNGAYLITKGDLNVRSSNVTIGNPGSMANTQIWAETIRIAENKDRSAARERSSNLNVSGSLYVANDLELNARESTVTLTGEYYGYNNGRYETQEKKMREAAYQTAEHTQSSAIIINGNQSALNLSGLNTLVVAGVAYVDTTSKAYSGALDPTRVGNANTPALIEEYATGESLALKSNQYLYLAPSYCLTVTNPIKYSELETIKSNTPGWSAWSLPSTGYFGFNGGYVRDEDPVIEKVITNNTTGEKYTYFYLNFQDEAKKAQYANLVLNMTDPQKFVNGVARPEDIPTEVWNRCGYAGIEESLYPQIWELKKSLQDKATNSEVQSVITVANDAHASIYTRGAITQVSAAGLGAQIPDLANALSVDYISKLENNMQKHYKWFYGALDPKEQFSLTSDSLVDPPAGYEDLEKPADEFVNWGKIAAEKNTSYKSNSAYRTVVRNGNCTISGDVQGIIICDGDVTISGGANVKGLVIARGKIYIRDGGTIEANRSIVQAIINEEMTEESKKKVGEAENLGYAIAYLKGFDVQRTGTDNSHRVSGTDYTDYMSFENWRKGEIH